MGVPPFIGLVPSLATVNSGTAPIIMSAPSGFSVLGGVSSVKASPLVTEKAEKAGPGKVSAQDLQFIMEGVWPVPKKLVEKARLWQFVNLAELLPSKSHGEDDLSLIKQAQAIAKPFGRAHSAIAIWI